MELCLSWRRHSFYRGRRLSHLHFLRCGTQSYYSSLEKHIVEACWQGRKGGFPATDLRLPDTVA
ncbi:hypothetical protein RchiOBHm_Chr5g0060271 [Rosa chinensis]|uniref:Uncharacterized protein n=1 Tax=Rosa chinensis TaxID=74649 RepID=A0A2P6QHL3_ROSCH|nr:hypothetical protein RchiOBHm_Chr5g0060271 [Rosa chinensis]